MSAAIALLAVGLCAGVPAVCRAASVPSYIRSYETAKVTFPSAARPERAVSTVSVEALGERFDVVLEPADVLAEGARTRIVDATGSHDVAPQKQFYRGHLADDPQAEVRLAIGGGALDGFIRKGQETVVLEPLSRYQPAETGKTLVYRSSDIDAAALPPGDCGAGNAAVPPSAGARPVAPTEGRATQAPSRTTPLPRVLITVVADYPMFQLHGADTTDYMLGIVNQVNGFYGSDLGVTLEVVNSVVYGTSLADPFSTTKDPQTLLGELRTLRGQGGDLSGGGDTHLLTGRDLSGSVIGIAYVGSVCEGSYATGLSQNFTQNTHLMSLLVGHEIGHNMGAFHDGQAGSPCESTGYGWVMWPSLSSDLSESFSLCSRASIAPVLETAACVADPIPETCGNAALDAGEECDDGNNQPGDCCGADCRFEATGASCVDDFDQCTDDVCDGSGACLHPFNSAPCDDHDICTFDGLCSSGACTPQFDYRPLERIRLKVSLRPGDNDDQLVLNTKLWAYDFASPPTVGGAWITISDGSDTVLYEGAAPPPLWVDKKGTGASFRYVLEDPTQPQIGSLTSMSVKRRSSSGLTKIKAKAKDTDLTLLQGREAVTVKVQIGDDVAGDCGMALQLACKATATTLVCR